MGTHKMGLPSLFEPQPQSRYRKYIVIGVWSVVVVVVLGLVLFFVFRFHAEDSTANLFLNDVAAGDFPAAYKLWHRGTGYAYTDFLQDWGAAGYYGPVHSFRVVSTNEPSDASGVVVVVDVSPFHPFPPENDIAKQQRTKEVRLWVQFNDHSISYAP